MKSKNQNTTEQDFRNKRNATTAKLIKLQNWLPKLDRAQSKDTENKGFLSNINFINSKLDEILEAFED
ncbi:MAG: hypothetical protein K1X86_16790 [Ignavibacteria bacterium]|nr:hypothetical protein [Ignavibacteria bacterium]